MTTEYERKMEKLSLLKLNADEPNSQVSVFEDGGLEQSLIEGDATGIEREHRYTLTLLLWFIEQSMAGNIDDDEFRKAIGQYVEGLQSNDRLFDRQTEVQPRLKEIAEQWHAQTEQMIMALEGTMLYLQERDDKYLRECYNTFSQVLDDRKPLYEYFNPAAKAAPEESAESPEQGESEAGTESGEVAESAEGVLEA